MKPEDRDFQQMTQAILDDEQKLKVSARTPSSRWRRPLVIVLLLFVTVGTATLLVHQLKPSDSEAAHIPASDLTINPEPNNLRLYSVNPAPGGVSGNATLADASGNMIRQLNILQEAHMITPLGKDQFLLAADPSLYSASHQTAYAIADK